MSVYKSGAIIGERGEIVKRGEVGYNWVYLCHPECSPDEVRDEIEGSRRRHEIPRLPSVARDDVCKFYANLSTQIIPKKEAEYYPAWQCAFAEYCLLGVVAGEYPSERRAGFFTL